MNTDKMIEGKQVLIVDDEPDVLETLEDLLSICKIDTATSFEKAKELLFENPYDAAVLDIIGVNGFKLVEMAKARKIPAIMLTAHALSSDELKRSVEAGAVYYAPKEEMKNIVVLMAEVFEEMQKKKSLWKKMFERLCNYYDNKFGGPECGEKDNEFWKKKMRQGFDFFLLKINL